MIITQERLRELLHYDPKTGVFRWRVNRAAVKAGQTSGCLSSNGDLIIHVEHKVYPAHRLAWLYMTGRMPPVVNHKDGDWTNNRWDNLRAATRGQARANTGRQKNNTSGFKGACWDKQHRMWRATISNNGRSRYLGLYNSAERAHAAYREAAFRLFGDFARGE